MAADGSDGTVLCLLVLNRDVTDRVLHAVSPQPVLGVRFVDAAADLEAVESAAAGGAGATVVLHRAMYDASFSDDEEACRRLALLRQLSVRCVLTDPLDRVLPFADRGALCALVARLAPTVLQPRWLVVRAGEDATAAAVGAGLRLPIVCKPLLACGPPRSHELVVALRLSALADVPLPALLQEYVPHGGRIFKVYCVGEHVHCEERPSLPDLLVGGEAGARFGTATERHGAATLGSGPQTTGIGSRGAGAGVSAWPNPCPDRTSATQAGTGDAVGPLPPASVCFCTQGSMPTAAAFGAAAAQAVTDSGCWALCSESEGARETGAGGGREQGSTGPLAGAGRSPTAAAAACDRDGAMRLAASLARALGVGLLGVDVIVRADGAGGNATVGGKGDGCASQPRAGICCCAGGSGLAGGCGCAGGCSGVLGCRDGTGGVGECGATECFSRLMVVDLNYMPNTSLRMADGGRALAQLVLDRHRAHREETPP